MKMRTAGVMAAFVWAARLAQAASASPPTALHMTWSLTVEADGKISRLSTDDTRVRSLHQRLEEEIRSWKFSPGKVGGQPATTESKLQLSLQLEPQPGDGYTVRLLGAATGGGYRKVAAPPYPASAAAGYRQGLVVLRIRYSETGEAIQVEPYEPASKVDPVFVRAAIDAAWDWTFEPEIVGGRALGGCALVPVCFVLRSRSAPRLDCGDWKKPSPNAGEGQPIMQDPAVRLESDVIGRVL